MGCTFKVSNPTLNILVTVIFSVFCDKTFCFVKSDLQMNDMESGTIAVHNEAAGNVAGFTEDTNSAGISVAMGEYTHFPFGSSEHIGALNDANISVVTGEYLDTPPSSPENVGAPNSANSVVTGEYLDTPPASVEHAGATNDIAPSVITGVYVDIPPVSTEHGSTTNDSEMSVITGEYTPETTECTSTFNNNNNVLVVTGEYVQIPVGSTEYVSATNNPVITGEYMGISPVNYVPPDFMASKV